MEKEAANSFAIFRLPYAPKPLMVIGNISENLHNFHSIEDNAFLVSPFNSGNKVFTIPFDKVEEFDQNKLPPFCFSHKQYDNLGQLNYIQLLEKGITKLQQNSLKKVVLANTKTIEINRFEPIQYYKNLEAKYPGAFVYVVSSPETGTWFGASPEPLIRAENNKMQTVSMAGTLARTTHADWSEKEREEQEFVSNYLEQKLAAAKLPFQKNGPFNYIAGKLTHLRTEYTCESIPDRESMAKFIEEINPTPAVAGIPKAESIAFIENEEGFKRNLYAGFIGLKMKENLHLFVNIRCMEWQNKKLTLFAGAGITAQSVPQKEWEETQNKMKTMEDIINLHND